VEEAMVNSPSSLVSALTEDAPAKRFEESVEAKREEIERALLNGENYELKDDQGRVFIIRQASAGK
jgi:hypothetical protein